MRIYDQNKIDSSYHRLRNLGYFHHVNPNLLEEGGTEGTIIFHAKVTEGRTGRLIGVLGYAPPIEGSESVPQLTGVVEFGETNLYRNWTRCPFSMEIRSTKDTTRWI